MRKEYYTFVYLDKEMIEDLYPQIFDDVIEKNIIKTKEDTIKNAVSGNLVNIVSGNMDGTQNSAKSENVKLVSSVTRKAQLLVNYFKTDIVNLQDIITQNQPFEDSIICVGKATFELIDIYDRKTGISIVYNHLRNRENSYQSKTSYDLGSTNYYIEPNDDSIFRFECGDTYRWLGDANASKGIMLNVSNHKMRKDIHHLTEMVRLGRVFTFYIFGELNLTDGDYYSISPFAIWQ